HLIARLQGVLELARAAGALELGPADLARVQHRVAPAAVVHERRFHARQHVLHAPQVDVADHRALPGARAVVLNKHRVLPHADLNAIRRGAHNHLAIYGLAARQELRFGDDQPATTARVSPLSTALLLRLEARRPLHLLRLGDQLRLALLTRAGRVGFALPV